MKRLVQILVSASLLAAALSAQAQFTPGTKVGVFPGRLPPDITVTPPSPPPSGLPSPWQQTTIGAVTAGDASSTAGVLTATCYGNPDVNADTGHFVYESVSGDFEMVGQLQSVSADDVWSRYVPVVRQSTAAGAKYAGIFFDHRNFYAFNWRTTLDGSNSWVGFETAYTSPQWWRIVRAGNNFAGYVGTTSTGPWTLNGSASVTMSDPVDAGILCGNGSAATSAVWTSSLPNIQAVAGGSAGTVQFTQSTQSVNENGSALTVSVSRTGGSTGAGSVVVSRAGTSTAVLTTDYTVSCTLPCTLNWSGGDAAD